MPGLTGLFALNLKRGGRYGSHVGFTDRVRVAVILSLLNRGDGSPEVIVLLRVPCPDDRVGRRHIGQGEESSAIADVVDVRVRNAAQSPFPENEKISQDRFISILLIFVRHRFLPRIQHRRSFGTDT